MEKMELNIPSSLSQSYFIENQSNDVNTPIHIKEVELNYFYCLIYLYRTILMEDTPNIMMKSENGKYVLNELIVLNPIEIKLNDFNDCEVIKNNNYTDLKIFIHLLSKLSLRINIFNKDSGSGVKTIQIIESFSLNKTNLTIHFTNEFVKMILLNNRFFMKFDLKKLFELSGYKSKRLYLILKDYVNHKCKDFSDSDLIKIIGNIPQKSVFEGILKNINNIEETDMTVGYTKKRKHKFTMKVNNVKVKNIITPTDDEWMIKAKKSYEVEKSKGNIILNKKAYINTIYQNLLKENEKSDSEKRLDIWVKETMDILKESEDINYRKCTYMRIIIKDVEYFLQNDYTLTDRRTTVTKNADETLSLINLYVGGEDFDVKTIELGYVKEYEKICFLSEQQLRNGGFILNLP